MTTAAFLVLCSAFFHALWNARLARAPDKDIAAAAAVGVALLGAALVALVGAVGRGVAPFAGGGGGAALTASLAAGVLEAGYFALLAAALARAPLGVAYTVSRGTALVVIWPVSLALLGERLTLVGAAGALAVAAGLALAGLEPGVAARAHGGKLAVVAGLFIAGYHLAYKRALAGEPQAPAVFAASLGLAWPLSLARLGAVRRAALARELRARPWRHLATGAACGASFLLFLGALAAGGAGLVLTLRSTSILFASALAWRQGERPGARSLAGVLLVAAGAAALAAPSR